MNTDYRDIREKIEAEFPIPKCDHHNVAIRHKKYNSGVDAYVPQCLDCGERVGQNIPKKSTKGTPDPWDEVLEQRWKELVRKAYEKRDEYRGHLGDEEGRKRQSLYNTYLKSPEWRRRREKIMKRANGTCEGCLSRPATQVHHLTYKNLGAEFAFELVAICDHCHDRYHQKNEQQEAAS